MLHKSVLGTTVSLGTYTDFITEIFQLVKNHVPSYVCFANVHMVMEADHDHLFQSVVNNADVVAPDGRPISLFLNLLEKQHQQRVCGMDMLPDLLHEAELENKSVYFLGGTDELLNLLVTKAKQLYPRLQISGSYSPPFRQLSTEEDAALVERIRQSHADLVFVSLGCPKQEKWMAVHRDSIGACLLGVGQAFKVFAGVEKRLPRWMRNLSLEWVYRLSLEPGRLWKRYLVTNSEFLFLTLTHALKRFFHAILNPILPIIRKEHAEISKT